MDSYWAKLAYQKRDLTNCESEPLQFCGAIQPFGVLLLLDPNSGQVVGASENAATVLGVENCVGRNLSDLMSPAPSGDSHDLSVTSVSGVSLVANGWAQGGICGIELETQGEGSPDPGAIGELKRLLARTSQEPTDHVAQVAAEQVRALTGFDRVMVYRFQPNWDGQVLGEARREDLEPFLGLFYPATDIPAQARKLYAETPFRAIPDTAVEPLPLQTRVGLGRSEVDLSRSWLRACSPIHIQYLQNMGVRASFSLPLKVNGNLWGLISCHHYSGPKLLSPPLRAMCELAAQIVSGRLNDLDAERRLQIKTQILELSHSLLSRVTRGATAVTAFRLLGTELMALTNSSGAFVRIAGEECSVGECPDRAVVDQLWSHLRQQGTLAIWETSSLSNELGLRTPIAAGALAVPLSWAFDDFIIWFRPEVVREVKWGGKPSSKASTPAGLEPRASFAQWIETVQGRSREWTLSDRDTAQYLLFHFVQGLFSRASDLSRANAELEKVARAKDEFIGMISHELRTPVSVMLGWVEILRDMQKTLPELEEPLDVLERNAKLQVTLINDLLDIARITSGKMRLNLESGVDTCALCHDVVANLTPTAQAKRIELTCEPCDEIKMTVDPERLRQILWNLLMNAIKFTPKGGKVTLTVEQRESACFLIVKDTGVGISAAQLSRIFERFSQVDEGSSRSGGLGLGLAIVRSLVELHGGTIRVESEGENQGSSFIVRLPVFALKAPETETTADAPPPPTRALDGWRILLAEDQNDAALATGYLLKRHGAEVTTVANGREALEQLKAQPFNLLLSDVGMPEMDGLELVRQWRRLEKERQTGTMPAVALTAYASSADRTRALEAGFDSHVPKPVDKDELLAVLRRLLV